MPSTCSINVACGEREKETSFWGSYRPWLLLIVSGDDDDFVCVENGPVDAEYVVGLGLQYSCRSADRKRALGMGADTPRVPTSSYEHRAHRRWNRQHLTCRLPGLRTLAIVAMRAADAYAADYGFDSLLKYLSFPC